MPPPNNNFPPLTSAQLERFLYSPGTGRWQGLGGLEQSTLPPGVDWEMLKGLEQQESGLAGGGLDDLGPGGGLVQTGEDITLAPIVELLMEMRARRESSSGRAQNAITSLLAAAPKLAPAGAKYFPGYEHGGIADIMMGFLSGKGKAHGALPEELRAPGKVPVDMSLLDRIAAPEPGVETDFPMASDLAMKILQAAMRTPRFAQQSASASSDQDLQALFSSILGGQ